MFNERHAEMLQEKETHLKDARDQWKAKNSAVQEYISTVFSDSDHTLPCVDDLENKEALKITVRRRTYKVIVLCEDYGQSIPLPSYSVQRPNVDYIHFDLHLHMLNMMSMQQDESPDISENN